MGEPTTAFHVAAIPSPGWGHINPLLNLCKLMAQTRPNNNLQITFIVTQEWLSLLLGGSSDEPSVPNLKFATIPNVIPPEKGRGTDLVGFMEAVRTKMAQPVEELLDRLEPPVQMILSDTLLAWAVEMGSRRNLPVASFWTMSASMFSLLFHYDHIMDNLAHLPPGGDDYILDNIPGISSISIADLPYGYSPQHKSEILRKLILHPISMVKNTHCLLFRTIYKLDEPAIRALKPELPVPIYTVGPCIPFFTLGNTNNNTEQPPYIAWLNSQPRNSVLYVSLGSVISVSSSQIDELVAGLQESGVRFLWVSRDGALRFEGGGVEKWMVVPWCDQFRVLDHESVGGFLTHCGWNSILEGVFMGVPMITFPLFFDQKPNSKLVVEDWGVGWRGKTKVGAGDSVVGRERIAEIVKRFMDSESDERKDLERRCREVREIARAAVARGGSAEEGLDAFFTNISKI